jgi:2-keto-4-pentenoate hydratase/2-oxohepta-3-ene-1,7-dioic acid hydratase in catechol pathway
MNVEEVLMRIAMAKHEGESALIMPMNGHWIDVTRAYQDSNHSVADYDSRSIRTIQGLLDHGLFNKEFYQQMVDFVHGRHDSEEYVITKEPRFMLPLRPGKIVAIGRNYKAHVEDLNNKMPEEPLLFSKSRPRVSGRTNRSS